MLSKLQNMSQQVEHEDGRLHKLISSGHIEEAQRMIASGADVNELFGSRGTPLCAAISANQPEIVKTLIQSGCDINKGDSDNEPPLCLAVRKGYIDIVKLLVENVHCHISKTDPVSGQTALHLAIINLCDEAVSLLLNSGRCECNFTNSQNETPVSVAVRVDNYEAVRMLINAGCALDIADQQGDLPIHTAAALPSSKILNLLLQNVPQPHIPHPTSQLNDSCSTCDDEAKNTLKKTPKSESNVTEHIINEESKGEIASTDANKKEKWKTADREVEEISVFMFDSPEGGRERCIETEDVKTQTKEPVKKEKGKVADKEDTEIELSLYEEIHPLCKQNGGPVSNSKPSAQKKCKSKEKRKYSQDHCCSSDSDSADSELEAMLDYFWGQDSEHSEPESPQKYWDSLIGWNVNSSNKVGHKMALHVAIQHQSVDNVLCLIKHGADLNIADGNGNTPLVYACVGKNHEIARILLEAGSDPNGCGQPVMLGFIIPGSKTTALYAAIDCKADSIVDLLIQHGANLNVPSGEFNRQPLLNYCLARERIDLADKFLQYAPGRLDLTATDRYGHNCLFPAIKCDESDEEFIEKLISLGVDINQPNKAMEYPLESCVSLERTDLVETFLKAGAYVNEKDEDGCTALHIAVMQDDPYSTGLLMQYGSDMRSEPNKKESLITIAFDYFATDMVFSFIKEGYKADKDCRRINKKINSGKYVADCFIEDDTLIQRFTEVAMTTPALTLLCRNTIREHFIDFNLKYSDIYKLQAPQRLLDFISMKDNVWKAQLDAQDI